VLPKNFQSQQVVKRVRATREKTAILVLLGNLPEGDQGAMHTSARGV